MSRVLTTIDSFLCNPILLRCIGTRRLMHSIIIRQKINKRSAKIFFYIITTQSMDKNTKLSLNFNIKRFKIKKNLWFTFYEIQPCHMRIIINGSYEIFKIKFWINWKWTPNIWMNKFKRPIALFVELWGWDVRCCFLNDKTHNSRQIVS